MTTRPGIDEVRAAAARIRGLVRKTPLVTAAPLREQPDVAGGLLLKLESLQVTGSFKARGAINAVFALSPAALERGVTTASGGNHGLAVAYAGWAAGVPATIFLPHSVAPDKLAKFARWGAQVEVSGGNLAALRHAEAEGLSYIHPFADPAVIAGQGTIALEVLEEAPDLDSLIVAIGGGGLISGIAIAARALRPGIRIIGVEPTGAPTLHDSLAIGRLVELARLDTAAVTLAPRRSAEMNFAIVRECVEQVLLVEDRDMREAARWLWRELGVGVELSGAAAVAALLAGAYRPAPGERVCAIVCGSGTDGVD
ncbi:MAG: pyridoxal-phosphate dependent enzyme [Alphaproteobacteria bacterium]|nr:MAG: pyridoxal-phosphate dependent enzyme [Alphaproteobacteria bacterium]